LKTRAVLFDLGGTLVEICDGPKTFRRVLRSMGTARRESVIEQAILDTEKRLKAEGFMEKFGKIPCAEFWVRYDSSVLERLEPSPDLERPDSLKFRERILTLSQSEAEKLGIGKSTLYHLRKHATGERSFTVYQKTARKLRKA